MKDARLGIVRVPLPGSADVPLQFTYARIDERGHGWVADRFKVMAKGGKGSSLAIAELMQVASGGVIQAAAVMSAPMAEYPLQPLANGLWAAWELAKLGPNAEAAEKGDAPLVNPKPTLWRRLFGRRSATA